MRTLIAAWRLKRRHRKAPRHVAVDPSEPRFATVYHMLDGVMYVDRIEDSEACVFAEAEWDGYWIGERFCWTHGGHSTERYVCPRHPERKGA